jgi:cell wall-associated NlpC family hydrolase
MTKRAEIVAEARTWIGTPWQHQARLKGVAVDCVGLVIGTLRNLGLKSQCFDIAGYPRVPDGSMLALADAHLRRIARADIKPGDVLAFAISRDPQHMGIVGDYRHGGLSVIHANSKAGRVVETRLMLAGNFKLRAAYSVPGVSD